MTHHVDLYQVLAAKTVGFTALFGKILLDIDPSASYMDLLSIEKVTTTGLLILMLAYFYYQLKRTQEKSEAKALAVETASNNKIEILEKRVAELTEKLEKSNNEKIELLKSMIGRN